MPVHFVGRHPNRAGQFCIRLTPGVWITGINEGKNFSPVHSLFNLINGYSSRFHISPWHQTPGLSLIMPHALVKALKLISVFRCVRCVLCG